MIRNFHSFLGKISTQQPYWTAFTVTDNGKAFMLPMLASTIDEMQHHTFWKKLNSDQHALGAFSVEVLCVPTLRHLQNSRSSREETPSPVDPDSTDAA